MENVSVNIQPKEKVNPPVNPPRIETPQPKSNKGIIIFLVVLVTIFLIGVLFIVDYLSSPGLLQAKNCFTEEAEKQKAVIQRMKGTNSQDKRLEIFCDEGEISFNRLINCLEAVKAENSLSVEILKAYPKYQDTIQETISSHNEVCPNSLISLP